MKKYISLFIIIILLTFCIIPFISGCDRGKINDNTSMSSSSSVFSTSSSTSMSSSSTSMSSSSSSSSFTGNVGTSAVPGTSSATATSTAPVFARFDFGTKSYAEAQKQTKHESLVKYLSYDADNLKVEFTEDTIKLTALKNGTFNSAGDTAALSDSDYFKRGTNICYRDLNAFAVKFDNFTDFDFEDDLLSGYGTWANYPFNFKDVGKADAWRGYHQYMKIRLKNNTPNNKIAMQFNNSTAFASTQFAVMSVGADKDSFETYIYDLCYASGYPSGKGVLLPGQNPGNNWTWKQNTPVTGLRFHLLGSTCSYANAFLNNIFDEGETAATYDAYSEYFGRLDTRELIKEGNSVEIDYIIFGSTPEQLMQYKSDSEMKA